MNLVSYQPIQKCIFRFFARYLGAWQILDNFITSFQQEIPNRNINDVFI